MGRYSSDLDRVAKVGAPQRSSLLPANRPRPASQPIRPSRPTTATAIPTSPSSQSVRESGERACRSQDPSLPIPHKDKGKKLTEDLQ